MPGGNRTRRPSWGVSGFPGPSPAAPRKIGALGRREVGVGAGGDPRQLEETVQKAQMSGSQEEGARGGERKKREG